MSIPAILYDGSSVISPTGTEIAAVTVQIARRASYVGVPNKLDTGWTERVGGVVEARITAEGITDLGWIATLYARQDARTAADYHVAMVDGDAHTGSFVVEELTETGRPDDGRRRFRLVLLSNGRITYSPAA